VVKSRQRFRSFLVGLLATVGVIVAACFAVIAWSILSGI